jgi:fluoride ion exporter CrcB/FEX
VVRLFLRGAVEDNANFFQGDQPTANHFVEAGENLLNTFGGLDDLKDDMNRMVISPDWRAAIAVGFFGGYTTFSSFGWETAKMLEDGEWLRATAYVAASVVAGLLLSVAGIRLANQL